MTLTIVTNHHRREVIDAWDLTPAEREEFDYLDWAAIERGEESASFFRYGGDLHDLGEFTTSYGILASGGLPEVMAGWDAYRSDSAFSAMVVRLVEGDYGDHDVIVGRVYS